MQHLQGGSWSKVKRQKCLTFYNCFHFSVQKSLSAITIAKAHFIFVVAGETMVKVYHYVSSIECGLRIVRHCLNTFPQQFCSVTRYHINSLSFFLICLKCQKDMMTVHNSLAVVKIH